MAKASSATSMAAAMGQESGTPNPLNLCGAALAGVATTLTLPT
jgi:hypothetical protein